MNYLPICIQKTVNLGKLSDELLKQNLIQPLQPDGTSAVYSTEETVTIYVHPDITQEELDAIEEAVEAHDPSPVPEPLSINSWMKKTYKYWSSKVKPNHLVNK